MAVACCGVGKGGRGEAELRKTLARRLRGGEEGGGTGLGLCFAVGWRDRGTFVLEGFEQRGEMV